MANCNLECTDPKYDTPLTPAPYPSSGDCDCEGGGGSGGSGEGHKYTFHSTATGWSVYEDGRQIYTYTDKNENTTYKWQATDDGWLVKDNNGNTVFNYVDKTGKNTTYSFEETDNCGIKVTDSDGVVVFEYENDCAGTTYSFEQIEQDFKVTNDKTGQVVFEYKGTKDTNTTYTWEDYKDGFKVTDSDGVVAYIYDPTLGDRSDGSYPIDTLLATVFKGHTTISTGQIVGFTPAKLVVGETLVYDGVGTVGVITKDNGDGTYEVTTMTISPGSRQGVRLGSVDEETDLPATCAAAEAKGWQTPQLGDFAYVIKDSGTADDVISEYVITDVDENCNLTWTFSHSFNAGQYQEQSTSAMSGMILTGGVIPGTFGTPLDPSTFIRGVMRNGVLLVPDAQGKVNVIVDDSHVIVNALPTTDIKDHVEYIVIDANKKVTSTWVHDPTGWYQTYEQPTQLKAHQIVDKLPTTGIEEYVEYVVVETDGTVAGTWVYNPTKGWVQTEKPEKPGHIVVTKLPTTGIDDQAEYVLVEDATKPTDTFKATYVHTNNGWVETSKAAATTGGGHIAVTELPTKDIVEGAEYIVMTDTSDPDTITGTWVYIKNNWVQTEKIDNEGFHLVTALPTTNIDDKHTYIVVTDLDNPDTTFVSQAAYDSASKKWIDLTPKTTNVYYNMAREGGEVKWGGFTTPTAMISTAGTIIPWNMIRGTWNNTGAPAGTIKVPANTTVELEVYIPLKNSQTDTSTAPDMRFNWFNATTNTALGIGTYNPYVTGNTPSTSGNRFTYSATRCFYYENATDDPVYIQLKADVMTVKGEIQGAYSYCFVKEIGRVVDPVSYLDQNGEAEDTPVGTVQAYMGTKAPTNYLLCDGTVYNVGTYPELEAFIGNQYGRVNFFGGDGATTWAVPDLRGEFLRGAGGTATLGRPNAAGANYRGVGAAVGVHQNPTQFPNYWCDNSNSGMATAAGHVNDGYGGHVYDFDTNANTGGQTIRYSTTPGSIYPQTTTHGWAFQFTSRPTNTAVNWIIKCQKTPVVVTGQISGDSVALKMAQPTTWPLGVEQSFGNKIYGIRQKGTYNTKVASAGITVKPSDNKGQCQIINYGGWFKYYNGNIHAFPYALYREDTTGKTTGALTTNLYASVAGGLFGAINQPLIPSASSQPTTDKEEWEVWVLYTR